MVTTNDLSGAWWGCICFEQQAHIQNGVHKSSVELVWYCSALTIAAIFADPTSMLDELSLHGFNARNSTYIANMMRTTFIQKTKLSEKYNAKTAA
jgi:hypothetical protein